MKTSIGLLLASMALASPVMAKSLQTTGTISTGAEFCYTEHHLMQHKLDSLTGNQAGVYAAYNAEKCGILTDQLGKITYKILPATLRIDDFVAVAARMYDDEKDMVLFLDVKYLEWK